MRMKLARNYNFDRHLDASHQRDLGTSLPVEPQATDTTLLSLARASGRSASLQKEEDLLLEQLWSNATAEKHEVREEGMACCMSLLLSSLLRTIAHRGRRWWYVQSSAI